jgi:tight adherence protein B
MMNHLLWMFVGFAVIGSVCFGLLVYWSLPTLTRRFQIQYHQQVGIRLNAAFLFVDTIHLLSIQMLITVILVGLAWLFSQSWVMCLLVALMSGLLPKLVLKRLKISRNKALRSQLPDAVMIISSGLRSGNSFLAAMDAITTEMAEPVNQEFALVLREIRIGRSLGDALNGLEIRYPLEELKLFGAAVKISNETGGNLAETLELLAQALRSKLAIEGKLDALTSQGRLQAWVVGLLPFAVAAILWQMDPAAMLPLFTTERGWIACAIVLVLQSMGMFFIRKIMRIDV